MKSEKRNPITRVVWSYFGNYFGTSSSFIFSSFLTPPLAVAFTNGALSIYTYDPQHRDIKLHKEIQQAHTSHINDLAFGLVEERYKQRIAR